ncbi:hypothetical protein G6O69_31280 [Pseudenhygromyxa sp. WMMC2535]|uniref:hypothetical protein n=1 Tax=Pseudenhygromyxa sp. WMMC2535 TaxID=2712867 RepID=UPI0015534602|nr:hypothetical protein [Pseudenhygromyxa sp. WMMC2535]NVB42347.1 hypothetical protein [Pseudenhygromyxa sp. WMMC2535]
MPGPIHNGLITLFANNPRLAFEVASRCGAPLHLRRHDELQPAPTVFSDPADPSRQPTADWVVVASAEVDGSLRAIDGLIIEAQTKTDLSKLITWDIYRAGLRSRHACRAWTMVISPSEKVRRWAHELFDDEPWLRPLIVLPEHVRLVRDVQDARENIEAAVLSAVMHSRGEHAVASTRAALTALFELPAEHRRCYLITVVSSQTDSTMTKIAQQLPPDEDYELSEFEMESAPYVHGHRRGLEEGLEQGHERGREQGRKESRREAIDTMRKAIFSILDERGTPVDDDIRAQVYGCRDLPALSRWLIRAASLPYPSKH